MNSNPESIPHTGVWLTDAEGYCLASVQQATPAPQRPGMVSVQVLPRDHAALTQGTGDWRVHDRRLDMCFCVQALSCCPAGLGYDLTVSSLGQTTSQPHPDDDDYLVMPDQSPVPLYGLVVADSQCPNGPHARCELPAYALTQLPVTLAAPPCRTCGQQHHCPGPTMSEGPIHHWPFYDLLPQDHHTTQAREVHAQIVRLRHRTTLHCRFHVALHPTPATPSADQLDPNPAEPTVFIGHITATETWTKPTPQSGG